MAVNVKDLRPVLPLVGVNKIVRPTIVIALYDVKEHINIYI